MDGTITLRQKLDREFISQHIITVAVKDTGTPSKKNFARLIIDVEDHNDHAPQFLSQLIQTKLHETADIGTSVVQAFAVDTDHGENVEFLILSGLQEEKREYIEISNNSSVTIRSLDTSQCSAIIHSIHGKKHFGKKLFCNG